ncbi:MAG: hypothetical protein JWO36_6097 [Myxococcales bacterium]|nr:hypothetical protein [Myxococcales bacterium]
MIDDLQRLRNKLCRELAQSEHDAVIHTAREARRLGDTPPAAALRAITAHAREMEPSVDQLLADQPVGRALGRAVAQTFSTLRHLFFDRLIDAERSFRGTLLGLRHGVDCVRLLREVGVYANDVALMRWCDQYLLERLSLLEQAEQTLAWFAERPSRALQSGLVVALQAGK